MLCGDLHGWLEGREGRSGGNEHTHVSDLLTVQQRLMQHGKVNLSQ